MTNISKTHTKFRDGTSASNMMKVDSHDSVHVNRIFCSSERESLCEVYISVSTQ